ncbi:MAG: transglutaminase-like domain-containing protein [Gemmatimonadaceae bacterium]
MLGGRALTGIAIVLAWLGGLGMLVRREFFRPHIDRLAEAALRVQPGAVFYAVMQGDKQVGFASSTIDTSFTMIEQRDYLVADILAGGTVHRATARTNVTLTRTLRLRTFEVAIEADQGPLRVQGEVLGDTVMRVDLRVGATGTPDTASFRLNGPVLLPNLVPLAVALDERPRVGKEFTLPVIDPTSATPKELRVAVRAESLFVVNDSSVFDSTSGRWVGVLPDTIRAWQLVSEGGSGVGGWVDAQGRLVATTQMGFNLRRLPYEVAFENWRRDSEASDSIRPRTARRADNRDVLESTAIGANKRLTSSLSRLRVRLSGASFKGFDLHGGRQRFQGDLLSVFREPAMQLVVRQEIIEPEFRRRYPELRNEPFLEVNHPEIVALAARLAGESKNPSVIAQRINQWVHDSLRKDITVGIPSAIHVLHTRRGDCNEHTQLFVALSRAAGIPARMAAGLAYVDGKFYYHAWPEVLLRGWVAVDPTFGQFPADASHLRFVHGGLGRQAELLRLMGRLKIEVVEAR